MTRRHNPRGSAVTKLTLRPLLSIGLTLSLANAMPSPSAATEPLGQVYVSASRDRYEPVIEIDAPGETFEWFVVAEFIEPVNICEFGLDLVIPPEITVVSGYPKLDAERLVLPLEHCRNTSSLWVLYGATSTLAEPIGDPVVISIGPLSPEAAPAFVFDPPAPAWVQGGGPASIHPFDASWEKNTLTLRMRPVPARSSSWGQIRGLFE